MNINILFCIGGDGTLRGAHAIHEEISKRKLKIAIAGIPKTIDNDIDLIQKSFGFETAFSNSPRRAAAHIAASTVSLPVGAGFRPALSIMRALP